MDQDPGTFISRQVDGSQVLIAHLDTECNFISVNTAYAEAGGQPASYFPGKDHFQLYPGTENEKIFRQVIKTGAPYIAHARPLVTDDQTGAIAGYWDWMVLPVMGEQGKVTGLVLSLNDVTREVNSEQKIHQSAEQYRTLFEVSPAINVISSMDDGRLIDINDTFEIFTGYMRDEVIGKTAQELGIWADPENREQILQNLETTRLLRNKEYPFRTKDGDIRYVWGAVEKTMIDGEPCLMYAGNDITDRKLNQETLNQLEDRFSKIFYGSPIIITVSDPETGVFLDVNDVFSELLGIPREDIIGKSSLELGIWVDSAQREEIKQRLQETSLLQNVEIPLRRSDGEIRYTLGSVDTIVIDGHHWLLYMATDLTDRLAADRALRESEQSLRSLAENSNDGIFVTAGEAPVFVNQRMADMLGYTMDELYGKTLKELIHPEEYTRLSSTINARLNGKPAPTQYETVTVKKDGTTLPVEIIGSLTEWRGQKASMGTVRDISERKANEADLERYREHLEEMVEERTIDLRLAKEEAEYANNAKTEFLSRVSHELRTPLNAIMGYTQVMMMGNEPLTITQQEGIKEMYVAGKHLLELINELLDISRIESNQMEMKMEPISIQTIVGESVAIIRPQAEQYDVELLDGTENCGDSCVVNGDHTRLVQVLLNLLSNAIKYTDAGGKVTLSCFKTPDNFIRIQVSDTGHGILEDKRRELFEPFNRLGAEYSGVEGTGIGLTITKRLVELMNGRIDLESTPGEGTTFYIDLPISEAGVCVPMPEAPLQSR